MLEIEISFIYNDFRRETVQLNPLQIVEENGGIREYAYDPNDPNDPGKRLSRRDPMGYETHYEYDAKGNVTRITHPDGDFVQFFDFNAYNQPQRSQDARGNWSLARYDAQGNFGQAFGSGSYSLASSLSTTAPLEQTPWAQNNNGAIQVAMNLRCDGVNCAGGGGGGPGNIIGGGGRGLGVGSSGGRLGNQTTRLRVNQVATEMESRGWTVRSVGAQSSDCHLTAFTATIR